MSAGAIEIPVQRLQHGADLPLPALASDQAAGADLVAAIDSSAELNSGQWILVPTGISLALPEGYEAQVRPRSGLALKHGVTVLNSPGTIDADYRGEVGVILINHGDTVFVIERGMRIAQLVIAPVTRFDWSERDELPRSPRGAGGFGSTGTGPGV